MLRTKSLFIQSLDPLYIQDVRNVLKIILPILIRVVSTKFRKRPFVVLLYGKLLRLHSQRRPVHLFPSSCSGQVAHSNCLDVKVMVPRQYYQHHRVKFVCSILCGEVIDERMQTQFLGNRCYFMRLCRVRVVFALGDLRPYLQYDRQHLNEALQHFPTLRLERSPLRQ